MKFHPAIDADNPERVAKALAWLWSSDAYPSSFGRGAWIVVAADDRVSAIHVRLRTDALEATPAAANGAPCMIGTRLSEAEVCALGAAEGWPAARRSRGRFHVIELWVENRVLIEVLTPEMQAQYATASMPARRAA